MPPSQNSDCFNQTLLTISLQIVIAFAFQGSKKSSSLPNQSLSASIIIGEYLLLLLGIQYYQISNRHPLAYTIDPLHSLVE